MFADERENALQSLPKVSTAQQTAPSRIVDMGTVVEDLEKWELKFESTLTGFSLNELMELGQGLDLTTLRRVFVRPSPSG